MVDKGCYNCYYGLFDGKAYPCSLCIRGIKRTDKWMPSKKTKEEIQTDCCETCKYYEKVSVECDRCDKSTHSRYEAKKGKER